MSNIQENIGYLKNIVEKREKYIHFSALGAGLAGLLFCLYPFVYLFVYEKFHIAPGILLSAFALLAWGLVTVLSILSAKRRKQAIFPKSIQYVLENLLFFGVLFCLSLYFEYSILAEESLKVQAFVISVGATLLYSGAIWTSRLFLKQNIVYFSVFLFILSLGNIVYSTVFMGWDMFYLLLWIVALPFGVGHVVVAISLFLVSSKTKTISNEEN